MGGAEVEWNALLVRSEGVVDQRNRAQYLVAQVDDPYNIQQRSKNRSADGQLCSRRNRR